MFRKIMGIITLKAPTYKAVAKDPNATKEAITIVVIVSAIANLRMPDLLIELFNSQALVRSAIGFAFELIIVIIFGLISWYVAALLLAAVAKAFGGKTDTTEMRRVTGYAYVFNLIGLLGFLAFITPSESIGNCIVGLFYVVAPLILSLIGYVIGTREVAELSTANAVKSALITVIAVFIINLVAILVTGFVPFLWLFLSYWAG